MPGSTGGRSIFLDSEPEFPRVERSIPNVFLLKARDPATASISLEARFEVKDRAELRTLLEMPADELEDGAIYELDFHGVAKIVQHYSLSFEPRFMRVELCPWCPTDDLPYKIHTDRELALMLAGTKPFAAFSDEYPSLHGLCVIPEREFEPHVVTGRIIKREYIEPPVEGARVVKRQRIGMRRVLYALPAEQWRIDAYRLLWKTAEKSGWNEGFERLEGALLGYEDWQNDYHIEHFFRKSKGPDSVA
jgi:hypothetical protein